MIPGPVLDLVTTAISAAAGAAAGGFAAGLISSRRRFRSAAAEVVREEIRRHELACPLHASAVQRFAPVPPTAASRGDD